LKHVRPAKRRRLARYNREMKIAILRLRQWIVRYAKMIGVVATIVIFGSWLVENLIGDALKERRDAIAGARAGKDAAERTMHLDSDILEVYQVAASARRYAYEAARSSTGRTLRDEVYLQMELLEHPAVIRDLALNYELYVRPYPEYLAITEAPPELAHRVKAAVEHVRGIRQALDVRRDTYIKEQVEITCSPTVQAGSRDKRTVYRVAGSSIALSE
jgi:hypothetical protein